LFSRYDIDIKTQSIELIIIIILIKFVKGSTIKRLFRTVMEDIGALNNNKRTIPILKKLSQPTLTWMIGKFNFCDVLIITPYDNKIKTIANK
jgi:hypothetical protein